MTLQLDPAASYGHGVTLTSDKAGGTSIADPNPLGVTVATEADLNSAIALVDVGGAASGLGTALTITLAGSLALTSDVSAINLAPGDTLTIDGAGHAIDGGGAYSGLFDYAGAVTVNDLAIDNAVSTGGPGSPGGELYFNGEGGGGAGAGLGGGLFVAAAGTATLNGVTFGGDRAVGGSVPGIAGTGADANFFAGGDLDSGGAGIPGITGTTTGSFGLGGGYGYDFNGRSHDGVGGRGGFGAGGGGGNTEQGLGGDGGFGGGGGGGAGYSSVVGSSGNTAFGNLGGFGAQDGGVAGGAGLGAGGAIFVQQGGGLTLAGGTVSGNSVAGGTGNVAGAGDGSAFGAGLFLQGSGVATLSALAGQSLTIGDVIADQTGSTHQTGLSGAGDPLAGAGSLVIAGPGTVALSAANTYSGGTTLGAGTLELLSPGAAGSGDIRFAGPATLRLDSAAPLPDTIDGFAAGDAIDLHAIAYDPADTATVSGSTVTIHAGAATETLTIASPGVIALGAAADGSLQLSEAPCFATGTRIATPDGERWVESLRAGDPVSLARGGTARVRWVGHRRIDLRRHPRPEAACPVRLRANSFGDALPRRDLVLSPEHALFLDGALVPAHVLIDGIAVVQEAWERVTYHHVELDRHDVLLAEGLPVESYLDTGNRHDFANGALASLHPDFAPGDEAAEPCAPMVLVGPIVDAARRALRAAQDRAGNERARGTG